MGTSMDPRRRSTLTTTGSQRDDDMDTRMDRPVARRSAQMADAPSPRRRSAEVDNDLRLAVEQGVDAIAPRANRTDSTGIPLTLAGKTDVRTKEGRRLYGIREARDREEGANTRGHFGFNAPDAEKLPKNLDGSVDRRTKGGRAWEALHADEIDG